MVCAFKQYVSLDVYGKMLSNVYNFLNISLMFQTFGYCNNEKLDSLNVAELEYIIFKPFQWLPLW
jgi:hypothetical protein